LAERGTMRLRRPTATASPSIMACTGSPADSLAMRVIW